MTTFMQITKLCLGDLFQLKSDKIASTFAQVGEGGDVGLFRAASPAAVHGKAPLFRVLMNEKDLRRHWVKAGSFPLGEELSQLAWYGDSDIGTDSTFKVRLDDVGRRIAIDPTAYDALEPLAVWETAHVIDRLQAQ